MKCFLSILLVLVLTFSSKAQEDTSRNYSVGVTFSLPWGNNYSFYEYELKKPSSKSGFGGLGVAFFYKKGKNKISLNFGMTSDLPVPLGPVSIAKIGTRTAVGSLFCEVIAHRQVYRKLNIIGGINYVNHWFRLLSYVDTIPGYMKHDRTLGITIGTEYTFKKRFSIALVYRPALISFDTRQYRHVLSIDGRFSLDVLKNGVAPVL